MRQAGAMHTDKDIRLQHADELFAHSERFERQSTYVQMHVRARERAFRFRKQFRLVLYSAWHRTGRITRMRDVVAPKEERDGHVGTIQRASAQRRARRDIELRQDERTECIEQRHFPGALHSSAANCSRAGSRRARVRERRPEAL